MAIIKRAVGHITLSRIVDVVSTTYFYLLMPSAAARPSKPTVSPPPVYETEGYSGWSETEPSYTSGDTRSLYITIRTIYGDGSFEYTTPSLSSSYEAAKTAYNRAQSAMSLAGDINQYFWNLTSAYSTNVPAGTYITEVAQSLFKPNPSGGNVVIQSTGITIRDGITQLSSLTGQGLNFYDPNASQGNNNLILSINNGGILQSGNYSRGSDAKFSTNGTKIDLTNGDIITKYFRVSQGLENLNAGAYIYGTIEALDGRIGTGYTPAGGTETNYWEIGNYDDYNLHNTAKIIGHGSSFIQLGDASTWRLSTNRIHTGWYSDNDTVLHYPQDSNNKYWDFGIHAPYSDSPSGRGNDKFIYIRTQKAANNSLENLLYDLNDNYSTQQWDYKFWVDAEGKVHAQNFYIGNSTTPIGGGVGTTAEKIINSDSTYGKGSATQPIYIDSNGRPATTTYALNAAGAKGVDTLISAASTSTNLPTSQAVAAFVEGKGYITSYTDNKVQTSQANTTKVFLAGTSTAGTSTGTLNFDSNVYLTTTAGTLHATTFEGNLSGTASRATADADGNTIKTTYLKLSGGNVTGAVTFGSSVSAEELTAGDLVVNGNASFTNNLQANTINGVAVGSSPKFTDVNVTQTATTTSAAYEVLFSYTADNTTRTEGARKTSTLTYNPNTKELTVGTVKIKEASTGFTISGGTTSKTLTVGGDYTLAAAAAKGVVTSIDTSANLPTSNAVKIFVEGKGYITANHTSTYSLPLAASGTRGGVQIGYTQSGKNYPVQLSSEKMYVNVPWTDTTYSAGTGLTLNGTTFKNYRGIEYIRGTWTAATNVWTGVSIDSELYDGKQIILYMPFAGTSTAATLELTLADGTTTGAKYVYFESTTRMTNHKGAYSQLHLIYHDSHNINGTNYSGWWYVANRDTNSNDTSTGYTRFSHGTFTATTVVGRYVICLTKSVTQVVPVTAVNNSTATTKTLTTDTFNPFEPIFYYTNNSSTTQTAANTALSVSYLWRNYSNINLSYSFNTGSTLTNNKDVFIKATPTNGYMATLASTPIVQDLPTTDDGFIYIKLGHACSTSNIAMSYEHPIYWYKNGAIRSYGGDAATVTGKTPLFAHQDISGKADKSATVSTITYDSTDNKITKTINGTTTDVVTVATIKSAIGSLKNPNAIKINVYGGTSTATTTTYDGSTANQSVDVAGSAAITNVSASAASGGSTTFTLTKANGDTSTFDVTVTASVATGATTITDTDGGPISKGSDTKPVYFSNGVPKEAKTYAGGTAVTLNGTSKAASTASFYAPTSAGTAKQILVSTAGVPEWQTVATGGTDGTIKIGTDEYAVKGLAAAAYKALADSSSASAIGTGTNVTTERDVYYGLPTINNAHSYTSSTNIYAPTTGGTSTQVLIGNGTTSAPVWTDISGIVPSSATNATYATYDASEASNTTKVTIADKYIPKSIGTAAGDIIYWSASGTPTKLAKGSNGQVLKLANGVPTWGTDNNDNTWRAIQVNGTDILGTGTSTGKLNLKAGSNVTITNDSGTVTIASSYTNTDTKVTQAYSTTNNSYPLLMTATAGVSSTSSRGDTTTILNNAIYANPSTGMITTFGLTAKKVNNFITGSGTAASDKGSGVSPRYFPAKWTFNIGSTLTDGDIITIKIPVAGHSYGVYLSIDNGTTYKPIVLNGTGRLTTHYGVNTYITLVYESTGSAASIYAVDGGDATTTITGGVWRVINYYDSNTNTIPQAQCETAAATAAKAASMTYYTATANRYVMVNIRYANTSQTALTLNINSTGAKPIYINGSASSTSNYTLPAGSYLVFYDGTNYYFRTDNIITGNITGNAATATKLASAQTVYVALGTASTTTTIQGGSSSAQTIGVNGTLAIGNGGTGLTASPSMLTNLGSTTAANVLQASPRPGVTGTLGIGNGGTGATTAANAINALLGGLPTWTANPTDTTYFIRQDTGGAASYGKATFSTLWNYISGKISSSGTYVTIGTDQTITASQKTFNGATRWSITNSTTGSKYGACNYDATLDALVFSFGTI